MAIQIQTVLEAVEDHGIKILVHGPAGAGKTQLCATTGETTIILSAEKGLRTLKRYAIEFPKKFKKIKVIQIESMDDLEEVFEMVDVEDRICEWICFDSVSEIAEQILHAAKEESNDPRQAYGKMQDRIGELLRQFRDLNYNVLMTCKQKYVVDGDSSRTTYMPALPGQNLPQQIAYLFDEVFALRVENDDESGEEYRTLQTGKDAKYHAKDRSGCLDMFEKPSIKALKEKMENFYDSIIPADEEDDDEVVDSEMETVASENETSETVEQDSTLEGDVEKAETDTSAEVACTEDEDALKKFDEEVPH
tara:strand:+ start:174 stop:1094 length:921 start_codon:yes stop_codon:yes gene_type:complete